MNTGDLQFKTRPYDHQVYGVHRFLDSRVGAFLCEMGTGKTKMLLDIVRNTPGRKAVVVAAPNGIHHNWGIGEIPEHFGDNCSIYRWSGTPSSKREKTRLSRFLDEPAPDKDTLFFLVNVEALRNKSGHDPVLKFLRKSAERLRTRFFVVDESTCIKNPKAQQTKRVISLGQHADRRFILNGTPVTQGPLDLWSQFRFLDKDLIPIPTYSAFRNRFAIRKQMTMGNRSFQKVVGYRDLESLTEMIRPWSYRLRKDDCLDLPERVWSRRTVELHPEQKKVYDRLRDEFMARLDGGGVVSVTVAVALIVKLHQVLTGFVIDDEGTATELKNHRLDALTGIAEQCGPLVVFCAYRNNTSRVTRALASRYGDGQVVGYYGGMKDADRSESIRRFTEGKARFFVGTSAAARGLNLQAADTVVYYSSGYSLDTRLQSLDRIHRIGQTRTCNYIDLVVPGTLDERILDKLKSKEDLADMVLDDLRDLIRGSDQQKE